ncbi:MAG: hypothetical protein DRQ64_00015 [Gammaproteobacteria bacterium]|nr:MAG: hypothetical protein DRQ64_00015 [Gammaproteobacteria bacterium]
MDLFISEPELTFERTKQAAVQLDEDPSMWPRQILQELFRQVPEASEYVPRVVMVKTDKEQGYGLGALVIASTTDSSMSTTAGGVEAKQALVPVIIKQNMLQPLDLLMTKNKMRPLTGDRLREALFRPSTFELMTKDWGDQSLYNLFYPPGRSENDFGSGVGTTASGGGASSVFGGGIKHSADERDIGTAVGAGLGAVPGLVHQYRNPGLKGFGIQVAGMGAGAIAGQLAGAKIQKMKREERAAQEKQSSLLSTIAPTLTQQDLDKLSSDIQAEPAVQQQMVANPSFRQAVSKLAAYDGQLLSSADSLFQKVESAMPTHVMQMGYDDAQGTYWVKTACRSYARQVERVSMSRGDFLKIAGPEVAQKVDTEGTVTVAAPNQDSDIEVDSSSWDVVEESGVYKVMTETGKEMMGWVIPNLLDMDGTRLPMSVFTNGTAATVQDVVAGSRIALGINLPDDVPKGTGIFYMAGPHGVEATVPVTVSGREAGTDGAEVYHVTTVMGGEHRLKMVPGLKKLMADQGNGEVMLPGTAKFLSMDQEIQTPLVSEPSGVNKTAGYYASPRARVYSDGSHFGFDLENLPKLASVFPTQNLSYDDATFLLCLAGVEPLQAHQALKKTAAHLSHDGFSGLYDVRPATEMMDAALEEGTKVAAATKSLRRHLIKEASVLPDIQTVDSVLSLGFINPENVRMYVGHLPYLDRALSSVCELTLASRLGLNEVPEFAAARACRALNEVIEGLKGLALREVDESAVV